MDVLANALPLALVPAVVVFVALAKLERFASRADVETIAAGITRRDAALAGPKLDAALDAIVVALFSPRRDLFGTLTRTARYTIASLTIFLFAYAYRTPDIVGELTSGRALPQVLLLGVLPAFCANLVVFLGHARRAERGALAQRLGAAFLLRDLLARTGLFVLLTAITFVPFSMLLGSDLTAALTSVVPTLQNALAGRSLMAAYLCSMVLGGLPFFVLTLARLMGEDPRAATFVLRCFDFADFEHRPLLAVCVVVASAIAVLAYLTALALLMR